jgi:hypothetical protein
MADLSRARLLLIVTGSTLRAEQLDRPLAYYLRQQVEEHLGALGPAAEDFDARVVADIRWLNDHLLQRLPTISIGGPGVNALAHRWLEELPLSLAVDEQFFVQMDPDLDELHASIWGMDNATTQIAVSVFIQRFLSRFLERCAAEPPEPIDPDDAG